MSIQAEIEDTLRQLGCAEPPSGLAERIQQRLQDEPHRFSFSVVNGMAAGALAASMALSAVALNPALRSVLFHHQMSGGGASPAIPPRVIAPAGGGFGPASAVHVPAEPVPVPTSPLNQGRGRSRSGRAVLPNGIQTPLPRGVAPTAPLR